MATKKRNIIVGQSGGPTSVINSSLAGVYKNAIERGFHKVYGMLHGIQGLLDEQYVDMSTQIHSDLDIELLKRTPSAFLGSCRYKLPEIHENMEIYEKIFAILDKLDIDKFLKKVRDLLQKKHSIVIAVSEGIKLADGRYVCELSGGADYVDAFGHKQLQGTAAYLAGFLGAEIGCKTRSVEFSTLQRSASHMASRVDIDEAFMVGGAAVKAADEGYNGNMVVIDRESDDPYMSSAGIYDVHRIANEEKLVPREWMNREGNYVTKDFVDYVKPLIQGDYQPIMVNGLPRHLVLDLKKR